MKRGEKAVIEARIYDENGLLLKGICPAHVTVSFPDGSAAPYDKYVAVKNGRYIFQLNPALNEPAGPWKVKLSELASGKSALAAIEVR